jgi:hypothetical protein
MARFSLSRSFYDTPRTAQKSRGAVNSEAEAFRPASEFARLERDEQVIARFKSGHSQAAISRALGLQARPFAAVSFQSASRRIGRRGK